MPRPDIRPACPEDCQRLHELILGLAEYERLAHLAVGTVEMLRAELFAPRPVIEAALLLGMRGGLALPVTSAPALAFFESRTSDELGAPFDPGHVLGPIGLQVVVGVVVGWLVERRS